MQKNQLDLLNNAYSEVASRLPISKVVNVKKDTSDALNDVYLNTLERIRKNEIIFQGQNHAIGYLTYCSNNRSLDISKRQENLDNLSLYHADIIIDETFEKEKIYNFDSDLFEYILTYKRISKKDLARIAKDKKKTVSKVIEKDKGDHNRHLWNDEKTRIDKRQGIEKEVWRKTKYFLTKGERRLFVLRYEKELDRNQLASIYGIKAESIDTKLKRLNNKVALIPIAADKNTDIAIAQSRNKHSVDLTETLYTRIGLLRRFKRDKTADKNGVTWLQKYRLNSEQVMRKHQKEKANIVPIKRTEKDKLNNGLDYAQTIKALKLKQVRGFKGYKPYNPCLEKRLTPVNMLNTDYMDFSLWAPVKVLKRVLLTINPYTDKTLKTSNANVEVIKGKRKIDMLQLHIGNVGLSIPPNKVQALRVRQISKCFSVCPFLNLTGQTKP